MPTIIVGDGLTNEYLGLESQYRGHRRNVGQQEISRLLGVGKEFGAGPLPLFLRQALEAQRSGRETGVILLKTTDVASDASSAELSATEDAERKGFVEPLAEIAQEARVIATPPDIVPWQDLLNAMGETIGEKPDSIAEGGGATRFLLVGCETDKRVLVMATWLRNVLGCAEVGVSAHLVGSSTQEAHFAALRHNLPRVGVEVFLDLEEAARFAGLDPRPFAHLDCRPCAIEPDEFRKSLNREQQSIIELLCMHWTRTRPRPLQGGFSGSLLLLADGWKGPARTEPAVLKIDNFAQMRRELDGYYRVKDFFGKHVPTFGLPVVLGDSIGVGMELAAMEGRPETLQDSFEEAEQQDALDRFLHRLDKALSLLTERLYGNTRQTTWVVPYREFWLHTDQQLEWLRENAGFITQYLEQLQPEVRSHVNPDQIEKMLRLVARNDDGLDSEVCLAHGDLNLANIICDHGDNIWFIDWTHSGEGPVELDFAKLENDVKFVMTKDFDVNDLDRLKEFEDYVLAHRIPADMDSLPDTLKFAKWDLRFRKILSTVRRIREACFSLKNGDDWLVYQAALLKYALHTLSFDKRRDRGECELPQLMHALYSVEGLVFNLVSDDFHLRIRAERPLSYPPRQRISIDESLWVLECPDYEPPYHVDADVLSNDRLVSPDGWADPEEFSQVELEAQTEDVVHRDDQGRPLNPRGRTGISGRGLLGLWGPNLSVSGIVTRVNPGTGELDILLGSKGDTSSFELPTGFVRRGETSEVAIERVLADETDWRQDSDAADLVFDGYLYDPRQTDHAWVEARAFLFHHDDEAANAKVRPGGDFDEIAWQPFTAKTVNNIPSNHARLVREAIAQLKDSGRMEESTADALLSRTG